MNKLKAAVCYQCATSLKFVLIFYIMQCAIVSLLFMIGAMLNEETTVNGLEFNTLIFVGVLSVFVIKDDFKMLTQHGFTRKYNFIANISGFLFICFIMAFIDTVVGRGLGAITENYTSWYNQVYSGGNIIFNLLFLFSVYMFICMLMYLGTLVVNKRGKACLLYIGFGISGSMIIISTVFRYFISDGLRMDIGLLLGRLVGFFADGTVNYLNPVLTFLVAVVILGGISYSVMRRTEIR